MSTGQLLLATLVNMSLVKRDVHVIYVVTLGNTAKINLQGLRRKLTLVLRSHLMNKKLQRVVCAANRHSSGSIVCGARHWDTVMCAMVDKLGMDDKEWEQGFIDNFCNFLTREEAMIIAIDKEQLNGPLKISYDELYSEHLY